MLAKIRQGAFLGYSVVVTNRLLTPYGEMCECTLLDGTSAAPLYVFTVELEFEKI